MSRILLLEPDAQLSAVCTTTLESLGYVVAIARTAQQAISRADDQRPDMVVMELQLVAHSGIEFLYEFRSYADWTSIPVVIHTHVPPDEFSASRNILMHELGVKTYLYKPQTSLRELTRSITGVIALSLRE